MRLADRIGLAASVMPAHRGVVHARRVAPLEAAPDGTSKHRLDAIGVWSVARVAVLFYLGVLVMIVLGIVVAWFAASQLGAVSGFERFMRSMGFQDFRLLSEKVVVGSCMIAAVVVATWVALTIAAVALYNAVSVPWGGVRVTLTPVTDEAALTMSARNRSDKTNGNGHKSGHSNGDGKRNGNGNGHFHDNRPSWALPDVSD